MKKSYFDSDLTSDTNDDEDNERALMDTGVVPQMVEYHNRALVHPRAEPSASVLPLQVSLDESEGSDLEDNNKKGLEIPNGTEANAKKSDKQLKKEARKQRYTEILFYFCDLISLRYAANFITFYGFQQGIRNQCCGGKGFAGRYTTNSR